MRTVDERSDVLNISYAKAAFNAYIGGIAVRTQKSAVQMAPTEIEPTRSEDLQEQVRRRAYELYELRGRENGHDLEDWLQAESELLPAGIHLALVAEGVKRIAA